MTPLHIPARVVSMESGGSPSARAERVSERNRGPLRFGQSDQERLDNIDARYQKILAQIPPRKQEK